VILALSLRFFLGCNPLLISSLPVRCRPSYDSSALNLMKEAPGKGKGADRSAGSRQKYTDRLCKPAVPTKPSRFPCS